MTKVQKQEFERICASCSYFENLEEVELTKIIGKIYLNYLKYEIKDIDKNKFIASNADIKAVVLNALHMVPFGEIMEAYFDMMAAEVRADIKNQIMNN